MKLAGFLAVIALITLTPCNTSLAQSSRPLSKFYFLVDISGIEEGLSVQDVTGLEAKTAEIEYRAGDHEIFTTVRRPGMRKDSHIILKRGVFSNRNKFLSWLKDMNTGIRRTVVIRLLDQDSKPTMTWRLTNAWPAKSTGVNLNENGGNVAFGTIDIAYERMTVDSK